MTVAKKIHEEILAARDRRPLVVFDLDSTLFNVSHRTQRILQDFISEGEVQRRYPEEAARLKFVQVDSRDWGLRQALDRHQIKATIGFFEELRQYWRERFFSNHYLHCDQPYTGAVDYVRSLAEAGVNVVYLTGRDRPDMFDGTVKSLNAHAFPLTANASELFMKPFKGSDEDEIYKGTALERFSERHELIYFFENEPVILNHVVERLPAVRAVFIDTVHCGRQTPPPHLPVIPGVFER